MTEGHDTNTGVHAGGMKEGHDSNTGVHAIRGSMHPADLFDDFELLDAPDVHAGPRAHADLGVHGLMDCHDFRRWLYRCEYTFGWI